MKVRGIFPRIAVFIFILHRETPAGSSPFITNIFENIEPHALIRIGDTGFSISYFEGFRHPATSRKNPNHRRFSLSFFGRKIPPHGRLVLRARRRYDRTLRHRLYSASRNDQPNSLLRIVKRKCTDRAKTKGGKNPDGDENKNSSFPPW